MNESTATCRDVCNNCNTTGHLKYCSRCMSSKYCSKECQRADWGRHKTTCDPATKDIALIVRRDVRYIFDDVGVETFIHLLAEHWAIEGNHMTCAMEKKESSYRILIERTEGPLTNGDGSHHINMLYQYQESMSQVTVGINLELCKELYQQRTPGILDNIKRDTVVELIVPIQGVSPRYMQVSIASPTGPQ